MGGGINTLYICTCSGGALPRVTILAEWLRYFNDLAVGETAEGAGMPPLLSH
jgi:hypothetical protein